MTTARPLLGACGLLSAAARLFFAALLVSGAAGLASVTQAATPGSASPPAAVGLAERAYLDPERPNWREPGPRPLQTLIWYPAPAGTPERDWRLNVFEAGGAARDAAMVSTPAKLPLVVLSHGTGGAGATLGWLAHELARHGYIVAAVNHHGNTLAEGRDQLKGHLLWWHRPRDLQVLIDRLLADPLWGPRIDPRRIGVGGFSVGGYTALAAAGVQLDVDQWQGYCEGRSADPICHLPPEADFTMAQVEQALAHDPEVRAGLARGSARYLDGRLRAALAIAPVLGPLYTPHSLAQVAVPVRIVVGAADDQSLPDLNARPAAAAMANAELQVLPEVTHYTFLPRCTVIGRLFASQFCADPPGISRERVQARVAAEAVRFFDRSLGPLP